jgi:hypothetical protein
MVMSQMRDRFFKGILNNIPGTISYQSTVTRDLNTSSRNVHLVHQDWYHFSFTSQ